MGIGRMILKDFQKNIGETKFILHQLLHKYKACCRSSGELVEMRAVPGLLARSRSD